MDYGRQTFVQYFVSAVHVYHEKRLIACAHVIGPDQLPVSSRVDKTPNYSAEGGLTLDPQYGERAFLIKNNQGDWGVVVGRWLGIKKGVPGTKGTRRRRGTRGIPGSYGYLHISFLKTAKNTIHRSNTSTRRGLQICIGDIISDGNEIELLRNHHEGAENVALAFAVGMLHVLCQPRSPSWSPGRSPNYRLKERTGVDLPPAEEVMLLKAAGILTFCACNRYVMDMHKMKISGQNDTTKSPPKNNNSDDDTVGSVGGDSVSLGGDSGGFNDDFMDSCGMDSCELDSGDIGGGSVCGSGGGGCGGGGCGGGGSSCGGGGSSCGGGGGCGGGDD